MDGLARVIRNCACCGVNFEMQYYGDNWCTKCSVNMPDPDGEE